MLSRYFNLVSRPRTMQQFLGRRERPRPDPNLPEPPADDPTSAFRAMYFRFCDPMFWGTKVL